MEQNPVKWISEMKETFKVDALKRGRGCCEIFHGGLEHSTFRTLSLTDFIYYFCTPRNMHLWKRSLSVERKTKWRPRETYT
jgi:hypothetical protein